MARQLGRKKLGDELTDITGFTAGAGEDLAEANRESFVMEVVTLPISVLHRRLSPQSPCASFFAIGWLIGPLHHPLQTQSFSGSVVDLEAGRSLFENTGSCCFRA